MSINAKVFNLASFDRALLVTRLSIYYHNVELIILIATLLHRNLVLIIRRSARRRMIIIKSTYVFTQMHLKMYVLLT